MFGCWDHLLFLAENQGVGGAVPRWLSRPALEDGYDIIVRPDGDN
jgi:hypothetical protein